MDMMMPFLMALVPQAPALVVWAAAVVVACLRWRRHPQVSMLAVIASVTLAVVTVASTYVTVSTPFHLRQSGRPLQEVGAILAVWATIFGLVRAGCWAMLIVALFGWRNSAAAPPALQPR